MRERDVPANTNDRLFRSSRAHAVVAYGLIFAGSAALFATGRHQGAAVLQIAAGFVGGGGIPRGGVLSPRFPATELFLIADGNGGVRALPGPSLLPHFSL